MSTVLGMKVAKYNALRRPSGTTWFPTVMDFGEKNRGIIPQRDGFGESRMAVGARRTDGTSRRTPTSSRSAAVGSRRTPANTPLTAVRSRRTAVNTPVQLSEVGVQLCKLGGQRQRNHGRSKNAKSCGKPSFRLFQAAIPTLPEQVE